MAKNVLCFSTGGDNEFCKTPRGTQLIELRQQARNRFSLRYGLQVHENLTYVDAARELGAAIMHLAAWRGDLDNRAPRRKG